MPIVICYGSLCADLHLWVPHLPVAGGGVHADRAAWHAGGNALNEARVLRMLGADVALYGDVIGSDPAGRLLQAELDRLGLRAAIVQDVAAQTPICHVFITPDGERSILAIRNRPVQAVPPSDAVLQSARIVSVARYGPDPLPVARRARALGCRVVAADLTLPTDPLADCADLIVVSAETLRRYDPETPVAMQAEVFHQVRGAAVAVSDGARPAFVCWREDGHLQQHEVAPVALAAVADTTGAGDHWRAAFVWGMLQGWPWPQTLEFACNQVGVGLRRQQESSQDDP
jgi:sulfofructose kinase